MSQHQFGSGLDDTTNEPASNAGTTVDPAPVGIQPEELTDLYQSSQANEPTAEPRIPQVLNFSQSVSGMPLDLGPDAKAVLVDGQDSEWLLTLDAEGRLHAAKLEREENPVVEKSCQLFPGKTWAAIDARTCEQTGHVIWVGVCRSTGDLYACLALDLSSSGQTVEPLLLGKAADLELPIDTSRVESLQLSDWFGHGRLELLVHLKPAREPGGHSLQLLERKSDNLADGFLPIQLADSDMDRLLATSDSARILHVAWSGPGTDQLLWLDAKAQLHLLSNFGGALPPGAGKGRSVIDAQSNGQASPGASISSLTWTKSNGDRPGRLVAVSSSGEVLIAEAAQLSRLHKFKPVLSKSACDLIFGPHAVATAIDWDNDGGLDILVGDATGGLTLYPDISTEGRPGYGIPVKLESGGLPFLVPNRDSRRASTMETKYPRYATPVLNDWTNFQRYDVVVSDNRGAVWYIRNNGGKTQPRLDFADRVTSNGGHLFVAPRCQLAVGHWSGTNEPDLIGFDTEGTLTYWPRKEKLDLKSGIKITDVRERPIALSGTGKRAGLVHLWAGAWTSADKVELILSMPRFAIGRLADWLEIPIEKPLEEFPLFWLLQKSSHGVSVKPLRTVDGKLIHDQMPDKAKSYSAIGVHSRGRNLADLLVVPEHGHAMLWPRESLRWD